MRDVTEWIRGSLSSRRGIERSIGNEGAPIDGLDHERATAILFIGSPTEPDSGAAMLASEPLSPPARRRGRHSHCRCREREGP